MCHNFQIRFTVAPPTLPQEPMRKKGKTKGKYLSEQTIFDNSILYAYKIIPQLIPKCFAHPFGHCMEQTEPNIRLTATHNNKND